MRAIDIIFGSWPTAAALARDIGVSEITVRQWRNRSGAIPVRYWKEIRQAAGRRGVDLPVDLFVSLSASSTNLFDPLASQISSAPDDQISQIVFAAIEKTLPQLMRAIAGQEYVRRSSPIRTVICKLGGLTTLSRALGHRNTSTVQGWWDREVIPAHRQREVLDLARSLGVDVCADDVIPARAH